MTDRAAHAAEAAVATLGRGSLARLASYRHHPGIAFRDPREEHFEHPTVIFTSAGGWRIHSAAGRTEVDPSVVVLGSAGRSYRASHEERIPSDRTMFLEIDEPGGGWGFGSVPLELFDELFSRQAVACTRAVARIQGALAAEFPLNRLTSLRMDVLTVELLIELVETASRAKVSRAIRPDMRERVVRAREYLDEHLAEDVDLRTLSREVALSPFHLTRLFRLEVGEPPHRYLVHRRLDRAAELLVSTPLTVTQVCDRVGFGSPAHFGQAFRRRFGMPPSVYRKLAP